VCIIILDIRFTLSFTGPRRARFFLGDSAGAAGGSHGAGGMTRSPGRCYYSGTPKGDADMAAAIDPARREAGPEPAAFDPETIDSRVEQSLVRKVRRLMDDFPEQSLDVVRGWMAEGY
jgi:hypothetical protein